MYSQSWRLLLAALVAFSHLQFSQIRGRQPYLFVRKILYVIYIAGSACLAACETICRAGCEETGRR